MQSDNLAQFTYIYKMILEKKAPLKERYARYNQGEHLQKAILNLSRLLNRERKEKNRSNCNIQLLQL